MVARWHLAKAKIRAGGGIGQNKTFYFKLLVRFYKFLPYTFDTAGENTQTLKICNKCEKCRLAEGLKKNPIS